jgi:hypothetical protein
MGLGATVSVCFGQESFRLTRLVPLGPAGQPFDRLELHFSRTVQEGTFTVEDVSLSAVFAGDPIGVTLNRTAADVYEIGCGGQTGVGAYALAVGPDLLDAAGGTLDQNEDGTPGQPDDAYRAVLFSGGATITAGDPVFDGRHLVVYGTAVTIDGAHAFGGLAVLGGGVVTHPATVPGEEHRLDLTLSGEIWIDAASRIDVDGRGYTGNHTLGNTTTGAATGSSGGSYGGLGYPRTGATDPVYGDYRDPAELGSGGGRADGGPGGGLVRLAAASAQIDGAILANGVSSGVGDDRGCGSGGGIRLDVGALAGAGRIAADGGAAGRFWEGGGGGGRVAVYYDDISGFDPARITAHGAQGHQGYGSVGTVYLKDRTGAGELRVDSHGTPVGMWTPLGQSTEAQFAVDRLVVSGAGVVAAPEHQMPVVARQVQVEAGGVLSTQATTPAAEFWLDLQVAEALIVAADSRIDVSGRGYPRGATRWGTRPRGAPRGPLGAATGAWASPEQGQRTACTGTIATRPSWAPAGAGPTAVPGAAWCGSPPRAPRSTGRSWPTASRAAWGMTAAAAAGAASAWTWTRWPGQAASLRTAARRRVSGRAAGAAAGWRCTTTRSAASTRPGSRPMGPRATRAAGPWARST